MPESIPETIPKPIPGVFTYDLYFSNLSLYAISISITIDPFPNNQPHFLPKKDFFAFVFIAYFI